MDPKVKVFMTILNIRDINDFMKMKTYMLAVKLKQRYADSTLEDYLWRLMRVLKTIPTRSEPMIRRYYILWMSVGGRPK